MFARQKLRPGSRPVTTVDELLVPPDVVVLLLVPRLESELPNARK